MKRVRCRFCFCCPCCCPAWLGFWPPCGPCCLSGSLALTAKELGLDPTVVMSSPGSRVVPSTVSELGAMSPGCPPGSEPPTPSRHFTASRCPSSSAASFIPAEAKEPRSLPCSRACIHQSCLPAHRASERHPATATASIPPPPTSSLLPASPATKLGPAACRAPGPAQPGRRRENFTPNSSSSCLNNQLPAWPPLARPREEKGGRAGFAGFSLGFPAGLVKERDGEKEITFEPPCCRELYLRDRCVGTSVTLADISLLFPPLI